MSKYLQLITRCESSYTELRKYEWVRFDSSTDEELRAIVAPISPKVGRAQLLALCRNRYKQGCWIRVTEPDPSPIGSEWSKRAEQP